MTDTTTIEDARAAVRQALLHAETVTAEKKAALEVVELQFRKRLIEADTRVRKACAALDALERGW